MLMRMIGTLEQEVAAIGDLSRDELVQRWIKTYGCPPPKGIKRGLLERSAAWHLQARHLGGLTAASKSVLRAGRRADAEDLRPISVPELSGTDLSASLDVAELPLMQRQAGVPHGPEQAGVPQQPDEPQMPDETEVILSRPAKSVRRGAAPPPRPGTRFMREWNGRIHVVDVTDDGFLFDGKTFRSLSAIAKRITGAHWSGPRFFAP